MRPSNAIEMSLSSGKNVAKPEQSVENQSQPAERRQLSEVFIRVTVATLLAWAIVFAVVLGTVVAGQFWAMSGLSISMISLASAGLSVAAMVPGIVVGRAVTMGQLPEEVAKNERRRRAELSQRSQICLIGIGAAMTIRVVGTVALFGVCRYHFGEPPYEAAAFVIGWYVFLTSMEVFFLSRGIVDLDQRDGQAESTVPPRNHPSDKSSG